MAAMVTMTRHPGSRIPRSRLESSEPGHLHDHVRGIRAHWLGQAGFLFEGGGLRVLVDPYLSDSLAIKYRGGKYSHTRMSRTPVAPEELRDIDFVLVSHSHSDHLDPGTLPAIASSNPECRFVIPESCLGMALERGIPGNAILTVNANDRLALGRSNVLTVIPSAHEELTRDENGHFLHLGYILELGGIRLYHSGDCSPYPGLAESLAGLRPDIAFLPVNGRDDERTANGIIGNFTLQEAVDLVLSVPIGLGVGHHFGLFDFNTIDPGEGARYLSSRPETGGRFILAEQGTMLAFHAQPLGQT